MLSSRHSLIVSLALIALSAPSFAQEGGGNQPPVCVNNGPYLVDANNIPGTSTTDVQLTSAGSFDPDGDPLSFFWFEECPFGFFADPTAPDGVYSIDMTGVCTRTCVVALRVTANGVTSACVTTVTVTDMSAPVITCPPDAFLVWGDPTDPANTGTATATDNNDLNPAVSYSDVIIPQVPGSGIEQTIVRTWTATDACGFTVTCTQYIYLASPSALGFKNLDLQLDGCPNVFDRAQVGTMDLTVLTNSKLKASNLDWSTVKILRRDQPIGAISLAAQTFLVGDFGKVTAKKPGDCNSTKTDGKADLRISVDRALIQSGLALDSEQAGAVVEVLLVGNLTNGKFFMVRDYLTVE